MSKRFDKMTVSGEEHTAFLRELEGRQTGETVAELRFYLRRTRCNLHLFLEGGGDKLFYVDHLHRLRPDIDDFEIYECGGRQAVLDLYEKFSSGERKDNITLFFVDRDLSIDPRYEETPNIFVTDEYSFENYFVARSTYDIFCQEYLGLTSKADRKPFGSLYDGFFASATRTGVQISTFVNCMRRCGVGIQFEDYPATRIAVLGDDLTLSVAPYGRKVALDLIGQVANRALIKEKWKSANRDKYSGIARGKYILSWFGQFLKKIVTFVRSGRIKIDHRVIALGDYSPSGIIACLRQAVETPESLRKFFERCVPSRV